MGFFGILDVLIIAHRVKYRLRMNSLPLPSNLRWMTFIGVTFGLGLFLILNILLGAILVVHEYDLLIQGYVIYGNGFMIASKYSLLWFVTRKIRFQSWW